MPVVALIDPNGSLQRELGEHLEAEGYTVLRFDRQRALLNHSASDPPEVVILAAEGDADRARGMTSELRRANVDAAVCWYQRGRGPAVVQRAEQPDAILFAPSDRLGVRSLMERAARQPRVHDAWSGTEFLMKANGRLHRYPPFRLIFLAHRVRATGRLVVEVGSRTSTVRFSGGIVVGVTAMPDLLSPLGVTGGPRDTLIDLLTTAIQAGAPTDQALATAADELGHWFAQLLDGPDGHVSVLPLDEDVTPMPLTTPIPQMLARGLRRARPVDVVLQSWRAHWADRIEARPPDDAPDSRWGIDPVALRLLRQATDDTTLDSLVGSDRRPEAVHAADLLIQLGIIQLVGAPPERPTPSLPPRKRTVTPPVEETVDDRVAMIEAAIEEFAASNPLEILGITKSEELTSEGVEKAFRQRSQVYHPDRFTGGSDRLIQLAELCFGLLVEARDGLDDDRIREEWAARLKAREEGRQHVGDADRRVAMLEFARGDVAFKRKRWAEAREAFEASLQRQPGQWRARYLLALSALKEGSRPPLRVLKDLEALEVPEGTPRADLLCACGEILLEDGQKDRARRCFNGAVREDPDHVDARRHLRLLHMRGKTASEVSEPSTGPSGDSFLGSILRRKPK